MTGFKQILKDTLAEFDIALGADAVDMLCIYNDRLIESNRVMNLTALTEPRDVALKHFADSLMLLRYCGVPQGATVIDVGTGAGFPGLVLRIARPDIKLTLLDSLQKRLFFLNDLCDELGLDSVTTVHSRAEDGARTELRDSFDIAVSRAVAPLNVLAEYCLPYVKEGGRFAAMKSRGADGELNVAAKAIGALGGKVKEKHCFELAEAGERGVIVIEKLTPTPDQYPRKSNQIKKKPL